MSIKNCCSFFFQNWSEKILRPLFIRRKQQPFCVGDSVYGVKAQDINYHEYIRALFQEQQRNEAT